MGYRLVPMRMGLQLLQLTALECATCGQLRSASAGDDKGLGACPVCLKPLDGDMVKRIERREKRRVQRKARKERNAD